MKIVFKMFIKAVICSIFYIPAAFCYWYKSKSLEEYPVIFFSGWLFLLVVYISFWIRIEKYVNKVLD